MSGRSSPLPVLPALVSQPVWPAIATAQSPGLVRVAATAASNLVLSSAGALSVQTATSSVLGVASFGAGLSVTGGAVTTVPGAWVSLSTVTASASATVDVETTFSSTYAYYVLVATGVITSDNNVDILVRLKIGGAYDTAANYLWTLMTTDSSTASIATTQSPGDTSIKIVELAENIATAAGTNNTLVMTISNPSSTAFNKTIYWNNYGSGTRARGNWGHATNIGAVTALTGVRTYASAGTISVGDFRLYAVPIS